jgi:hypothetical protein
MVLVLNIATAAVAAADDDNDGSNSLWLQL